MCPGCRRRREVGFLADCEVDALANLIVRGKVAKEDVVAWLQGKRERLREARP